MRPESDGPLVSTTTTQGSSSAVTANLDDLRALAGLLRRLSTEADGAAGAAVAIEWHLPARGDLLSPLTAATCAGSAVALAARLDAASVRAGVLSACVGACVLAYEAAEAAATAAFRPGRVAGALAWPLLKATYAQKRGEAVDGSVVTQLAPAIVEGLDMLLPGDFETGVNLIRTSPAFAALERAALSRPATTSLVGTPGSVEAPPPARSISGGMKRISSLYEQDEEASHIQVQRVVEPRTGRGHWTVMIPGTAIWPPGHGTVLDGAGNLVAAAGGVNSAERAVAEALHDAMEREGVTGTLEPIMLIGHSQGGMVMTNLARRSDDLNITRVVTYGSPVGDTRVPPGTRTLNIENRDDVVKDIDGLKTGEDDPRRTRVVLEAPGSFVTGTGQFSAIEPHSYDRYRVNYEHAVEMASADPEHPLTRYERDSAAFFDGEARTYAYEATRGTPRGEVIGSGAAPDANRPDTASGGRDGAQHSDAPSPRPSPSPQPPPVAPRGSAASGNGGYVVTAP